MSKRLTELLRQRSLLQEHLAWLDREIAAEQTSTPALATQNSPTPPPPLPIAPEKIAPAPPPAKNDAANDVEHIMAQYQQDPGSLTQDTRRGCLMFFGIAIAGTVLLTLLAYWLYARHLGRWW